MTKLLITLFTLGNLANLSASNFTREEGEAQFVPAPVVSTQPIELRDFRPASLSIADIQNLLKNNEFKDSNGITWLNNDHAKYITIDKFSYKTSAHFVPSDIEIKELGEPITAYDTISMFGHRSCLLKLNLLANICHDIKQYQIWISCTAEGYNGLDVTYGFKPFPKMIVPIAQ